MGGWKQWGLQQASSDGEWAGGTLWPGRGCVAGQWFAASAVQAASTPRGSLRAEVTWPCGLRQVVRDCGRAARKHEGVVVCKGRLVTINQWGRVCQCGYGSRGGPSEAWCTHTPGTWGWEPDRAGPGSPDLCPVTGCAHKPLTPPLPPHTHTLAFICKPGRGLCARGQL